MPAGRGARGKGDCSLLCAWGTVWRNEARFWNESSSLETRGPSAGPGVYPTDNARTSGGLLWAPGVPYSLPGARALTPGRPGRPPVSLSVPPGASHDHCLPPGSQKPGLKGS